MLTHDDLEIRVWRGFGVTALDGYVIKRVKGEWSGLKIPPIRPNYSGSYTNISITPKSGWNQLWKRLTDEGVLTLPDSSQLPNGISFMDGISYVVEINMNLTYRTYMYGDPQNQGDSREAKQMMRVIHTLQQELGT